MNVLKFGMMGLLMLMASVVWANDLEKAKAAFGVGKDAYDAGDYRTAALKFVEAYEHSNRAELLYNIGLAYQGAGELPEAETYFQRYLTELPKARNANEVVNLVIEIQQEIAANYGTLEINATKRATLTLDGERDPRCETPCSLVLRAGKYGFTARADGFIDTPITAQLEAGQIEKVQVELRSVAVLSYLDLSSDRGASVLIDGEPMARLPLDEPLAISPGRYDVELRTARGVSWTGQVELEPNATYRLNVPLEHAVSASAATSWKRQLGIVLGVSSLGFGIGGLWMGVQAQNSFDALEAQERNRGFVDADLRESGQNQASAANILYGVAGGVLAVGVGLFVWDLMSADDGETIAPSRAPEETPSESDESRTQPEIDLL